MRRVRQNGRVPPPSDSLPPHDIPAEQAALGCCLLDEKCVGQCLEKFGVEAGRRVEEVFYDLRHQVVFEAMVEIKESGRALDLITLQSVLHERNQLEPVGGVTYLSALPDIVPSAANLESYVQTVWEKYLARQLIQKAVKIEEAARDGHATSESGIIEVGRTMAEWRALVDRGGKVAPQDLRQPGEFLDPVMAHWFSTAKEEIPGLDLPFNFPLKIRPGEMTLMCGEDGSGKSNMTGQIAVKLMQQGWKGLIASLEVASWQTIFMLLRQATGLGGRLPQTPTYEKRASAAMAWLHARMWLYDFTGITHYRLLLDVMRYAVEKLGLNFFVIDSWMRLGIPSDDIATQDRAAYEFAAFAVQTQTHVFIVHHLNKARDASLKGKASGSKRITDNAHNIIEMQRNERKSQKLAEWKEALEHKEINEAEYKQKCGTMVDQQDAKFILAKQRFFGTPQNGSKWLWYDPVSLQFRDQKALVVENYLKDLQDSEEQRGNQDNNKPKEAT